MRNGSEMDLVRPWGAYRAKGWTRLWLRAGRLLPRGYVGSRLGLLTRRLARLGLSGPVDTVLWGQHLRFDPRGGVSEARILFLPQFWDVEERDALAAVVEPPFVFIDVGANVGGYAFWMASLVGPGGCVVAVEPDPSLADQLAFNIAASGSQGRIRLVRAAVSDADGEGALILNSGNSGENRLAEPGERPGEGSVCVPTLRLSRIIEDAGVDRANAVKVDVEGGEKRVLEAFLDETPKSKWPDLLIVEVKGVGRGDAPLVEWLAGRGYHMGAHTRLNGVFRLSAPPESGASVAISAKEAAG